MSNQKSCPSCRKVVEQSWRYCRYCGAAQPKDEEVKKPEELEVNNITREIKEKVEFNKDLYYNVLSTRSERTEFIKQKTQLKKDISSLLEQVEAGVVKRDYALPKIKELKAEVEKVNVNEAKFKDLPSQLPVEELLDQINDAEQRLKKIDDLKNDPAITKEAIREARKRSEDTIILLREEYSVIAGHLRNWHITVKNELKEERKNLEQLYIRMKTGELTEESYEEKKKAKVSEVSKLVNIDDMLSNILN